MTKPRPASRHGAVAAVICPGCGITKALHALGPVYRPRRWFRRQAYWHCQWCRYEWQEPPL